MSVGGLNRPGASRRETRRVEQEPPLLRGWLHQICFFVSLPAGALVVLAASTTKGRIGAIVYAVGLSALFGVSGAYHRRPWSPKARPRMKRLDHATICVMIAGTYTPLCLVALPGTTGVLMLAAVWVMALVGFSIALTGVAERRLFGLLFYIGLGWMAAVALPELSQRLPASVLALIVIGGVVYTLGAIVLGSHWPNPSPRVFGYHEVWHTMVVFAVILHFVAILSIVRLPAA